MADKSSTLTKKRVIELFPKAKCSNNDFQPLIEDYFEVFSDKILHPANWNPKYKRAFGDIILEPTTKYKNYYKKVFNPKQILSPFTASQVIEHSSKRIWIYVDQKNKIQGPFTALEMDNWYNKGFLPLDLLIGLADREKCVKLSDFISSTYPF